MQPDKNVIAIYTRYFLSISMTFIYRQLLGVSEWFDPIVLCKSVENMDVFPYEQVFHRSESIPEKIGTRVYRIAKGKHAALSPFQSSFYRRVLQDRRVRLIHAHFGPYGLDMLPIAKRLGIPLVVTFHGFDASTLLSDSRYTAQLRELFEYAHVITASADFHETLQKIGATPERLEIHHIGVPVEDFQFVNRTPLRDKAQRGDVVRFLQVSNFVEKKGHRYTVEAFSRFLSRYDNAELVFAGDGPLRPAIESMCREKNLGRQVRFVGRVTTREIVPLMSEADVFLHHSVTASDGDKEATTTVIAEAMATGLVVVSTLHGGIPEMITDGIEGFLVEERDVASYVDKLIGLLDCGPEIAVRASERIRENFNLSKQNAILKDIYTRTIDNPPTRAVDRKNK